MCKPRVGTRETRKGGSRMTQVIGNVLIIELTPEDKAKTLIEQIMVRYEAQIKKTKHLEMELERIRQEQRLMQFAWQG